MHVSNHSLALALARARSWRQRRPARASLRFPRLRSPPPRPEDARDRRTRRNRRSVDDPLPAGRSRRVRVTGAAPSGRAVQLCAETPARTASGRGRRPGRLRARRSERRRVQVNEARFTTWVYTITRNLCIDQLRKRALRKHPSLDQEKPGEEGDGPTLGEQTADPRTSVEREASGSELKRADRQGGGEALPGGAT